MSKRLRKHAKTLHLLANCDNHTAKTVIKGAKPELISCISDICYNTLQGKVKLSPIQKNKLAKYKKELRQIANKSTALKTKRRIIQKGGFLALLRPLLSLIGPIAKSLLQG